VTPPTLATRQKAEGKIEFRLQRRPHYLRVAIRGEASFDQAEVLSAQLLRMPLGGSSLVVVDLADLTFLSSLAMGALVSYRRDVGWRGVEVRLANVQAPVWLALESAGLGQLFERIDLEEPTPPAASEVP
jgi:anti-anti-sigma factor